MAGLVHFELITLSGTKFGEEVYEVILPTPDGEIAILPGHIPLVSLAAPGVIAIRRHSTDPDSKLEYFATNGGAIEVVGNKVRVLVDEADREEEINEQEAQKAFDRARQLAKEATSTLELSQAQSLMDRHAVRIKVAGLRRRKHH